MADAGGRVRADRRRPALAQAVRQGLSHPNIDLTVTIRTLVGKMAWLVENGWELLPDEKGGATIDRSTYRQFPAAYTRLTDRMNTKRSSVASLI